jgi:PilZ domain
LAVFNETRHDGGRGLSVRLREWIETFGALHEKARRARLKGKELAAYHEARHDLGALLLAAQRLSVSPGETAREALRVARSLLLDLGFDPRPVGAMTLDISTGGFSSLLHSAPRVGERLDFSLALGDGPVRGRARITSAFDQGVSFRVSFAFERLSSMDAKRIESEVLDAALEQLLNLVEHLERGDDRG